MFRLIARTLVMPWKRRWRQQWRKRRTALLAFSLVARFLYKAVRLCYVCYLFGNAFQWIKASLFFISFYSTGITILFTEIFLRMDPKVFQKTLPDDPSEEDYVYWKRMLDIYLTKATIPVDSRLDVLFVLCGSKNFSLIEECVDYDEAISRLESKFMKRSTAIMMRHKLLSRKQSPTESIEEYFSALKLLAKKCQTRAMSSEEHRDLLTMDAFVSGITSVVIRQRLLESSDESLSELFKIASTMELAIADSKSFENSTDIPTMAAMSRTEKSSDSSGSFTKCFWCGGRRHPRSNCPARNSVCHNCRIKGHWSSACRRKNTMEAKRSAAISSESDSVCPSVLLICCPLLRIVLQVKDS